MARAWGKVGAWADDSEAAASPTVAEAAAAAAAPLPAEAFPSLGEAANKPKKKKGQTLSLAEFTSGKYVGPAAKRSGGSGSFMSDSDRLTSEEMLILPTGPKERTEEELSEYGAGGRLGGGFRDYGGFRGDRESKDRDKEREQRGFGFDREREASRADDSSDWGASKPARGPSARSGGFDDDRRFAGDRDRDRDLPSKADEVDNWGAGKRFVPSERRSGFDDVNRGVSKADTEDNWGAGKKFTPGPPMRGSESDKWSFRKSDEPGSDGDRWSRRAEEPGSDTDRWSKRTDEPRRPRLNLQPRSVPADSASGEAQGQQGSRPTSSHSSRPGTPDTQVEPQAEAKPRPKVDPFGNAKPREVLLEQRGQDWRKLDSQLDNKRAESEEERSLKEEIRSLKELLKNGNAEADTDTKDQLAQKEQELEQLIKELDHKTRISEGSWRKDEPRKQSAQENEGRRPDVWKREDGKERARLDRW